MKTIITCSHLTIFSSHPRLRLIALALTAFGLVQSTEAVNPPPDGGYAGGNTAEGQNALLSLTTGADNTAVGFLALSGMKDGKFNTAFGAGTLLFNVADENTATGAGALLSNTVGNLNTANGAFALVFNTDGTNSARCFPNSKTFQKRSAYCRSNFGTWSKISLYNLLRVETRRQAMREPQSEQKTGKSRPASATGQLFTKRPKC